jgi:hypothetical protein
MSHETVGFEGYRAHDGNKTTTPSRNAATASCWWKIQLPYKKAVNKYSIHVEANFTNAPASFALEGSDDDAIWTSLNSQAGVTFDASNKIRTYTFTNFTPYKYYRLNVTANAGGAVFTNIYELGLFEATDHFYVIPEGAMYYYSAGSWAKVSRLFVGECRTGAATVSGSDIVTYALRGQYISEVFDVEAATNYAKTHAVGCQNILVRALVRYSDKFPWADSNSWSHIGSNATGANVMAGGEFCDPFDDRNEALVSVKDFVLRTDTDGWHPGEYIGPSGLASTTGQVQLHIRRAF